jgi:hypothetical protein
MKKFEFIAISVMIGIAIGLRFKVLILVIAVVLAAIFTVILGISRADNFCSIFFTTITIVVAIQLSYLGGLAINAMVASFFPDKKGDPNPDQD